MQASTINYLKLHNIGGHAMLIISSLISRLKTGAPVTILIFYLLVSCAVSMPPKKAQISIANDQAKKEGQLELSIARFPIGFEDFRRVVQQTNTFVDKTLLIRDIIDLQVCMIVINRPRRWGKSITLNMLSRFFTRQVDKNGLPIYPQPDRVLFEGGMVQIEAKINNLLPALKIAKQLDKCGKRCMDYQGIYPVIQITFLHANYHTLYQIKRSLSKIIKDIFVKHKYLLKSWNNVLASEEKEQFQWWLQTFEKLNPILYKNQKQIESISLQNAVVFLSKLLKKYHNQKVIILIDEYDRPFNNMLMRDTDINERNKVAQMFYQFLSTILVDRFDVVYKAIFIGVHNTLLQGQQVLSKAQVCRLTEHKLSQHFGFSKEEIEEQLISKVLRFVKKDENDKPEEVRQALLQRISEWYNGYKVPVAGGGYRQIYNPCTVIKYLSDCVYRKIIIDGKPYWTGTISYKLLHKLCELGIKSNRINMVLQLNTKKPITLQFSQQSTILSQLNFYNERDLTRFLVDAGYLTGQIIESSTQNYIQAIIPNREMYNVFKGNCIFDLSFINVRYKDHFISDMLRTFEKCKKYFDNYNEAAFSDLLSAHLLYANKWYPQQYSTSIKKLSGDGFMHSLFEPLNDESSRSAIISEYKYSEKPQEAVQLYTQALWQIYEKDYIDYVLEKSATNNFIEMIVTRPIIIISSQLQRTMQIYAEQDIFHTIEEARNINTFFAFMSLQNKEQDKIQQQQKRKEILKDYRAKDLRELLQIICTDVTELASSIKELIFSQQKSLNIWPLNYPKVLWHLPYIFQRNIFVPLVENNQKEYEWARIRKRFISTFPNEQSLYRATLSQIFSAVQQKEKAEEIFSKLQQMKKDIRYRVLNQKQFKRLESPIRQTDRQVLTVLIQRDPLQQAFNRIELLTKQKIIKAKQQIKKREGWINIKGQFPIPKAKVVVDPFLVADQKLSSQVRYYERTGLVFQSLGRRLLEGTVQLLRESVKLSMFCSLESIVSLQILDSRQIYRAGKGLERAKRMIG